MNNIRGFWFIAYSVTNRFFRKFSTFLFALSLTVFMGQGDTAEQIVDSNAPVANQSQLSQSLNGTEVQNIAAPNANGLSHNKFTTFNVNTNGLIINNSRTDAISNLGGAVLANPNLVDGTASTILNEVTSANHSILQGPQELVGSRADYILANPNGITCNGCGFINFPRATLTTGTPIVTGGNLTGFDVNTGDILIEGLGLNATEADFFDIISRSIMINAAINAKDLNLIAGRNTVDYATRIATAKAGDGSTKPSFAIDSSILGGMYANRISLVGTEAGVGVRLAGNMAASVDDISLNVNGKISFNDNQVSAVRDISIVSNQAASTSGNEIELNASTVYANRDVSISGGDMSLSRGRTGAGNNLTINANSYTDNGSGQRDAGNNLQLTVAGAAIIDGSSLLSGNTTSLTADSLSVQNNGKIYGNVTNINSTTSLTNTAFIGAESQLNVSTDSMTNSGTVYSAAASTLLVNTLNNSGKILAEGTLNINSNTSRGNVLNNTSGGDIAATSLNMYFDTINNSAKIYGNTSLSITTTSLLANSGEIQSSGSTTLSSSTLTNNAAAFIGSGGQLTVTTDSMTNSGTVYSAGSSTMSSSASSMNLYNSGEIIVVGTLDINSNASRGIEFRNNLGGVIAASSLNMYFNSIHNYDKFYGDTSLSIGTGTLNNYGGIHSNGWMTLSASVLKNTPSSASYAADIIAKDQLLIKDNYRLDNTSLFGLTPRILSTTGALIIDSTLSNSGQYVRNDGGLIYAGNSISITVANEFTNSNAGSVFSYSGDLTINANTTGVVNNIDSKIENYLGNINIIAGSFYNTTTDVAVKENIITSNTNTNQYFFDGTNYIPIDGANCGTNMDPGFVLGDSCVRSTSITYDQLVAGTNTSPRSKLLAGGDITITVENKARNYLSIISAGNNLTLNGAASGNGGTGAVFENEALMLNRLETATVYTDADGGNAVAYNLLTLFTYCGTNVQNPVPAGNPCFWIGTDEHYKAWNPQFRPNPTSSIGVGSTVEAGNTITINMPGGVTNNNGENLQLGATEGGVFNPVAVGDTLTLNINSQGSNITPTSISGAVSSTSSITISTLNLDPALLSSISGLAGSPFFVLATDPNAPFIFETDPNLISLAGLYSSDFFLDSLGLDPLEYLRLGDAYFEQQLLRQQILAEAGQLYIVDGLTNENEQYKYLLENAIEAKDSLSLRVGVALTAAQINNLEKDIVWMVETEVNGKKVLVPQLFLSNATRAKLAQGAKFVASNIDITTEGPVTNSGAFVASNNINVESGSTFTNRLGTLRAGNNLDIIAREDILNESGRISGGNVSLNSTEGSVRNITLTQDNTVVGAFGTGTNTIIGDIATIEATNNLNIIASTDIISEGGQLNAGNNASLDAGNDITLTGIEVKSYNESYESTVTTGNSPLEVSSSATMSSVQRIQALGSGLNVGGNLTTTSGNDTNIIGSDVNVVGNADIQTGGDLNIKAATETTTVWSENQENSFFESSGETGNPEKDGVSGVSASGDVTLLSMSKTTSDMTSTSARASGINIGGNLNATSKNDINIVGSDILVAGNGNIDAVNDVNILAAEEVTTVTTESENNSLSMNGSADLDGASGGMSYSNETTTGSINQTLNRTSSITFGGDLDINAGNDITEQGTDFYAGGDTTISAGRDFNSVAAVDTYHETGTTKGVSVGVSVGVDIGVGGIAESFSSGNGANIATAATDVIGKVKDLTGAVGASASLDVAYNETTTTTDTTTSKVSTFAGGGNLNISAGRDANLQGTEASVEGDINLNAGNDVNITAAYDTETTTVTTLDVNVGVSVEAGGGGSLSGSGGDSTTTESTSTAKVAKLGAGGNLNITAGNNVSLEGTELTAAGDATIEATEGSVDFKAARDTYTYSSNSTEASAGIEASKSGGGISGGYAGSDETINASTATAGSINAANLTIKAKKDVSLEGTNLTADNSASIEATEGNIDFTAARDTYDKSSSSTSVDVSLEASKEGGGGSFELGLKDGEEHSNIATGGSINASNLTLKSGGDTRLEGTQVEVSDSASIETGGKLTLESAVSTSSNSSSDLSVSASAEFDKGDGGSGSGSFGFQSDQESGNSTTNERTTLNVGGKLVLKTGGDLELKAADINAGDESRDIGGNVVVEERKDSGSSSKSSVGFAAAIVVADKKTRKKLKSLTSKAGRKNAVIDAKTKLKNKVAGIKSRVNNTTGSIKTTVKNKVARIKNTVKNTTGSIKTTAKNIGANKNTRDTNNLANKTNKQSNNTNLTDTVKRNKDSNTNSKQANNTRLVETVKSNKDKATDKKLAINTAAADSKTTKNESRTTQSQNNKDLQAERKMQGANDKAAKQREQALATLDKDTSLDSNDRKQKKDEIEKTFADTKKENVEKLALAKKENAQNAETQKKAYLEKTAERKSAAENKAVASKIKHVEVASKAKLKIAVADKAKGSAERIQLKKQANDVKDKVIRELNEEKARKGADVTAEKDKAIASKEITRKQQESDIDARQVADERKLEINANKRNEDKKIDNDSTLSEQQKIAKKEENANKAELDKATVEIALARTKRENEKLALKEQEVADSKVEHKQNKTKADIVKDRVIADSRVERDIKLAQAKNVREAGYAEAENKNKVAIDRAEKRYTKEVRKAKELVDGKIEKAKQDRLSTDAVAKSEFDSKKQEIDKDKKLSDDEKATKLSVIKTEFANSKKENMRKQRQLSRDARKERAKTVDKADADKVKRIKRADKSKERKRKEAEKIFNASNEKLQGEHKANKRVASGESRKQSKQDEANTSLKEVNRVAMEEKINSDREIRNNPILSDDEKSLKLKNNATKLENKQNAAKRTYLSELKKQADAHDRRERDQEKVLVDNSDMTSAEKKTKKKEIDKKYKVLKTARQDAHDTSIADIKDKALLAKPGATVTNGVQTSASKPNSTAVTIGQRGKSDNSASAKPTRKNITIGKRSGGKPKDATSSKTTDTESVIKLLSARVRSNSDGMTENKPADTSAMRPRSRSDGSQPNDTTIIAKADTDKLQLPTRSKNTAERSQDQNLNQQGNKEHAELLGKVNKELVATTEKQKTKDEILQIEKDVIALSDRESVAKQKMTDVLNDIKKGRLQNPLLKEIQSRDNGGNNQSRPVDRLPERAGQVMDVYDSVFTASQKQVNKAILEQSIKVLKDKTKKDLKSIRSEFEKDMTTAKYEMSRQSVLASALPDVNVPANKAAGNMMSDIQDQQDEIGKLQGIENDIQLKAKRLSNLDEKSNDMLSEAEEIHRELDQLNDKKSQLLHELEIMRLKSDETLLDGRIDMAGKLMTEAAKPLPSMQPGIPVPVVIPKINVINASNKYVKDLTKIKASLIVEKASMNERGSNLGKITVLKHERDTEMDKIYVNVDTKSKLIESNISDSKDALAILEKDILNDVNSNTAEDRRFYKDYRDGNYSLDQLSRMIVNIKKNSVKAHDKYIDKSKEIFDENEEKLQAQDLTIDEADSTIKRRDAELDNLNSINDGLNQRDNKRIELLGQVIEYRKNQQEIDNFILEKIELRREANAKVVQLNEELNLNIKPLKHELDSKLKKSKQQRKIELIDAEINFLKTVQAESKNPARLAERIDNLYTKSGELKTNNEPLEETDANVAHEYEKEKLKSMQTTLDKEQVRQAREILNFMRTSESAKLVNNVSDLPVGIKIKLAESIGADEDLYLSSAIKSPEAIRELDSRLESILEKGTGKMLKTIDDLKMVDDSIPTHDEITPFGKTIKLQRDVQQRNYEIENSEKQYQDLHDQIKRKTR